MLLSLSTIKKEHDTKTNPGRVGNGESFPCFIGDYLNACPVASLVSTRNRPNPGRSSEVVLLLYP